MNPRAGFTLVELLMVILVISVIAAAALPALSDTNTARLQAAAAVLASDIETAQGLSISNPQAKYTVRFDPGANRWWVALTTTPDTPIVRSDTHDSYQVTLGSGRARAATGVTFTTDQISGNSLAFNGRGSLVAFTAQPSVKLSLSGRWIKLVINPNTGTITETAGSG